VTFNWKDRLEQGRQVGLIAQEVETVLPELVTTDKDAEPTKGVNYIGLVPVTIKAIQEQQAQIENQQERIAELRKQLGQQRHQIDDLKKLICLDHPVVAMCE
jgi:chaperonin cofactor prefoldin